MVNDALGLGDVSQILALQEVPLPAERFIFSTDPEKAAAFMEWLQESTDLGILEVTERDGRRIVGHSAWQNTFVEGAYSRGITSAEFKLRALGIDIGTPRLGLTLAGPRHADALGLLFTRNFAELQGITLTMEQQIARALVDGLAQGLGPAAIAQNMNDLVRLGRVRSLTLARTEIIRAHAEATLNRFQDFGLDRVQGRAEFLTAGDERVDDECGSLEGQEFTIDEARGIIPVHPNCRCTWLPIVPQRTRDRVQRPPVFGNVTRDFELIRTLAQR